MVAASKMTTDLCCEVHLSLAYQRAFITPSTAVATAAHKLANACPSACSASMLAAMVAASNMRRGPQRTCPQRRTDKKRRVRHFPSALGRGISPRPGNRSSSRRPAIPSVEGQAKGPHLVAGQADPLDRVLHPPRKLRGLRGLREALVVLVRQQDQEALVVRADHSIPSGRSPM